MNNSVFLSSVILTLSISLISRLSATALTGLLVFSNISISTIESWGSNAPFHLLGLNADIGVNANKFELIGSIGP